MKILIYGAGALGSVFGGYLAHLYDVILICRASHAEVINKVGLTLHTPEGLDLQVFPRAYSSLNDVCEALDFIIISVKTYDLEAACRTISDRLSSLPFSAPVPSSDPSFNYESPKIIILQNGLGNEDVVSLFFPPKDIFRILTSNGAFIVGPGCVKHSGRGVTHLGKYLSTDSNDPSLFQIYEMFTRGGVKILLVSNLKEFIWQKLAVNAAINPITALTGLNNGQVLQSPILLSLLKEIIAEVEQVAFISEGIKLSNGFETAMTVLRDTIANKSSMLQDIQAGRRTEIDFINGQIVQRATKYGLQVPYNRLLTTLIKAKEENTSIR